MQNRLGFGCREGSCSTCPSSQPSIPWGWGSWRDHGHPAVLGDMEWLCPMLDAGSTERQKPVQDTPSHCPLLTVSYLPL